METDDLRQEVKKAVEPVMTAFEEFKSTNDARLKEIEKKGSADPLVTEKLDRIETSLAAYEGLNQRVVTAEAKAKAAEEQTASINAVIAKLEAKHGRPALWARDPAERALDLKTRVNLWARAVISAHTIGVPNLSAEQQKALADVDAEYKALTISNDTTGGYLAVPEFVPEIIKAVVLFSPIRSFVRVRQTANKSLHVPKRTGVFAAKRTTEQGTRTETTGLTYGLEEIAAPEMYALIDISNENLEDSAFDLAAEIQMEAAEQFAVKEGQEFATGTGVGECEGIITNAGQAGTTIGVTNSGAATTINNGDAVLSAFYAIKTAYAERAKWVMNRTTLGSVRKLKDGMGNYLWMPGIAMNVPNSINGAPYVEVPDMPNEGAGTFPIGFGDWMRAYTLVDRIAMTFLRDPYTQAASGNVRMHFRRRVGGKVVLGEAIRLLKCST